MHFLDNSKVGALLIGMFCTPLSVTVGQCRVNSPAIKSFLSAGQHTGGEPELWFKGVLLLCSKQDVLFSILVSLNLVGGGRGLSLGDFRFNSEEVLYDLSN